MHLYVLLVKSTLSQSGDIFGDWKIRIRISAKLIMRTFFFSFEDATTENQCFWR